jgi:phosphohistidine phosphatase
MQLLVIRHAIAEDREDFADSGKPDSDRPLTTFGKRRMRRNVRGLRRAAPSIDLLASSPFRRALDTARIVGAEYEIEHVEELEALTPERAPRELMSWLAKQDTDSTVAVVGHEPHLGLLVTWLISGENNPRVLFKKGGACLLEIEGKPMAGSATLQWLLTPFQLRALGD